MNEFAIKILSAPIGATHLFFVGQAGFVLKSKSGRTLAIDIYLSDCGERIEKTIGFKRLLPKILSPQEIVFDYIIATHPHFDHYDIDAIPFLMSNSHTTLFVSPACKKYISSAFLDESRVKFVHPSESFRAGGFFLSFINCDHGELAPDAVGVIIEVDGKRILVVGDSCLRLDRKNEYLSRGPIDVMIAPINGAFGNLNEIECVELSKTLQPKITIPCHYGMFARHGGAPYRFMEQMQKECPDQEYNLLCMGESIII